MTGYGAIETLPMVIGHTGQPTGQVWEYNMLPLIDDLLTGEAGDAKEKWFVQYLGLAIAFSPVVRFTAVSVRGSARVAKLLIAGGLPKNAPHVVSDATQVVPSPGTRANYDEALEALKMYLDAGYHCGCAWSSKTLEEHLTEQIQTEKQSLIPLPEELAWVDFRRRALELARGRVTKCKNEHKTWIGDYEVKFHHTYETHPTPPTQ